MDNEKYELSEEYRDRFAFNEGERHWMTRAFQVYKEGMQKELRKMADDGKQTLIHPRFFDQFFIDIENKLDCWTDKRKPLEEEEE